MSDNRGIFSLEEFYDLQVSDAITDIFDVFVYEITTSVKNNFGFFAGYHDGGYSIASTIYRQDFTDDTVTSASQLTSSRGLFGAISNTNHGYYYGGREGGNSTSVSKIDRIDFSNFTTAASPKGNLSDSIWINDGVGNTSYGYVHGANLSSYRSNIYRIDYSNDTATAPAHANLPFPKYYGSAMGNQSYGYWAGGNDPSTSNGTYIHRIDFSNDTANLLHKGTLSPGWGGYGNNTAHSGQGNANYGYVGGGEVFSTAVTQIRRIDYSSDTSTTVDKGNLATGHAKGASSGNHSNGYFAGGSSTTQIQRTDFSNDTATASTVASLPGTPHSAFFMGDAGTSPLENGLPETLVSSGSRAEGGLIATLGPAYGYWAGGTSSSPSGVTTIDRVDFSNDTGTASPKGNLIASRYKHAAVSSINHAYMALGSPYPQTTNIGRIDYADDTATVLNKGTMGPTYVDATGVGTKDYGYFCGGLPVSTVQRIDYANDTATAAAKGPLSAARRYLCGVGNRSYGYLSGGTPGPGYMSTVDRIDYSSDTSTATVRGALPFALLSAGATGNADYGYTCGGFNIAPGNNNFLSTVTRIDYSNDSASPSPKGNLTQERKTKSTGSTSYGWSGGGSDLNHAAQSTVDRIDFANDTATAAPKGPLSIIHKNHAAASGQQNNMASFSFPPRTRWVDGSSLVTAGTPYGYSAGGASPGQPITSRIDRLDFSNDTANTVAKGNLVSMHPSAQYAGKDMAAALGNTNFAYFAGGNVYPAPDTSQVSRLDYANDSADCVSKGPLSVSRKSVGGTGNTNFGYVTGGTGSLSYVDRIDYSNDTVAAAAKGSLTLGVTAPAGAGTLDFGYFSGGDAPGSPGSKTIIQRIDYSNDTANTSPKGNLSLQRARHGNTGNKNFGYHSGGYDGSGYTSNVERTTYSNDTATASPKGPLTSTNAQYGATGNQTGGYIMGGDRSGYTSTIEKIDYSNDTATATAKGNLDRNVYSNFATSGQINGFEAVAAPFLSPFPNPTEGPSPTDFGYFAGGYPASNNISGATSSATNRIEYSSDTQAASPKGNLVTARAMAASSGGFNFGYTVGGVLTGSPSSSYISSIDRVDYGNDTVTAAPKGNLVRVTGNAGAVGNKQFTWIAGGGLDSRIQRIDYSNDTATTSPRGTLTVARNNLGASGNKDFGYITGGQNGPLLSSIDRITYSSDTAAAAPKGVMTESRCGVTATGNASYAYIGGGSINNTFQSSRSNMDRINFSDDTATTVTKGPLSISRSRVAATGNASFGYFTGGKSNIPNSGSAYSTIDRLDFSNDTAAASPKGSSPSTIFHHSAFSAAANAIGDSLYPSPASPTASWAILMHTANNKGTESGGTTKYGNTGSTTWQSITANSTGADGRTAFGDGQGLYNSFFTKTGITKVALVDGTGNMNDMTSHNNYLVYDLVDSGTGSETMYQILYRLDQYNLNNPSWAGSAGSGQFVTDSCTNFTAAAAVSGNLTATSGTWETNTEAPAPLSPSPSTRKQPHAFCIWGVNRDSDDDTQVLCAYAGDLSSGCGKSDSWRGTDPRQSFWSYWGNDWHSNSQNQTISRGKQSDPGVANSIPSSNSIGVYLMALGE